MLKWEHLNNIQRLRVKVIQEKVIQEVEWEKEEQLLMKLIKHLNKEPFHIQIFLAYIGEHIL